MKKIILFASALAGLFLAASCQRENLEPEVAQVVTYTVQVPGALGTKAIGVNVDAVTELVYEVYRTEALTADDYDAAEVKLYQKTAPISDGTATVDLELVNNQNFRVLFWAQVPNNGVYTTTDLKDVTLKQTLAANAENYAAFAGSDYIKYGDQLVGRTITLVRPVSQLNIATTSESLVLGENGTQQTTVAFENTAVTVDGLSTSYNVAEGIAATDEAKFTYAAQPVGLSEQTLSVNGISYTYVAMNYVGFAQNTGDNVKVSYTIKTDKVGVIENTIDNVPVKPNYRTNIVGNLITSTSDYTITLEAEWEDEENVEVVAVSTAADLQDAINNISDGAEGNIKLEGDINLSDLFASLTRATTEDPKFITINKGLSATIDLNGYSITGVDEGTASFGLIYNMGNLTITNSSSNTSRIALVAKENRGWNAYSSVISNNPGGNLLVKGNVLIEHLGGTDMAYGIDNLTNGKGTSAIATVEGATVKSTYRAIRQFLNGIEATNELYVKDGSKIYGPDNKSIWMQDPSKNVNTGKLVVEAGAELYGDVYLTVTAGSAEWPVEVSIADAALQGESTVLTSNVPVGYEVFNENGIWIIKSKYVAKIGEKQYRTLNAAVQAVEDGETITLVADETFTENNRYNNGGWWDGLGYSGDKSFTIDLDGYTIKQDGSLNDYLVWIKNDGAKANTITFKNGTMDAGKTAYCALCTANSHENKLTVNLENITLINENSNGSTVKIRAGSELNVRAGTKITGKDSYLGVENWNAVVNIYDGAEIYMNGTSSYNGCLVGVGGNGTVNVYGGYGKGVSGGLIAMTSGGTINAMGGEWIANTDGTFANSNKSVLVAQSDKQYNAGAGNAVVNVTGGTYKGGYNCYGNAEGDAQINIKGGNFNADPKSYVVNGYKAVESNGVYNVVVDPVAKIGETEYATLQEAFNVGGNVTLLRDVTITETAVLAEGKTVVLDLNGKTLAAADMNVVKNNGGNLTIKNGTVTRTGDVVGYSVNNESGEIAVVNATIQRGLYTSGSKMTATNANISHEQSSRHAIYAWNCEVTINSGTFHNGNAGNATLMASGSSVVTINGGTFSIADGRSTLGWTSSMIDQNSTAQVLVKGGLFNGGFRINSADTKLTIEGGEFNTNNGSAFTDYSGTKVVKSGKFTDAGAQNWAKKYIAEGYEMNANGEVVAK